MFTRWKAKIKRTEKNRKTIELILGHDGRNWTLSGDQLASLSAPTLDELDRKLESALEHAWKQEPIEVFMTSDNEMIPGWMRPFMNHYFNRILELPLRYS